MSFSNQVNFGRTRLRKDSEAVHGGPLRGESPKANEGCRSIASLFGRADGGNDRRLPRGRISNRRSVELRGAVWLTYRNRRGLSRDDPRQAEDSSEREKTRTRRERGGNAAPWINPRKSVRYTLLRVPTTAQRFTALSQC